MIAKLNLWWTDNNLRKCNLWYRNCFNSCCYRILVPLNKSLGSEVGCHGDGGDHHRHPEQSLSFGPPCGNMGQPTYRGGVQKLPESLHPENYPGQYQTICLFFTLFFVLSRNLQKLPRFLPSSASVSTSTQQSWKLSWYYSHFLQPPTHPPTPRKSLNSGLKGVKSIK